MYHATYDFNPKLNSLTHTQPKSRTKTPTTSMSLHTIHVTSYDPL